MILFDKVLKIVVLMSPFVFLSSSLSCTSSRGTNVMGTNSQQTNVIDTISGDYYEISKNPKQWIKLTLTPDTFYLNKLQEGIVKLTLSENHPWASTGHYVTVQRWENNKWLEVKGPEREVRNSILKIFKETSQFEHPFSIPVYFRESELVPGRYRIIKSIHLYKVRGKEILLVSEFRIVK